VGDETVRLIIFNLLGSKKALSIVPLHPFADGRRKDGAPAQTNSKGVGEPLSVT